MEPDNPGQSPESTPNPYESPKGTDGNTVSARCSFCRKVPADGPLMQGPDPNLYICESCAKTAVAEFAAHSKGRNRLRRFLLGLLAAVGAVVLIWDAFFSGEPQITVQALLIVGACFLAFDLLRLAVGTIWRKLAHREE
jgi:hypothetical protein